MPGLLIVGAGGHGKVVADTARNTKRWEKIAFIDDQYPNCSLINWPVIGNTHSTLNLRDEYPSLIVAIGDNVLRTELINRYKAEGFNIPVIIHPTAYVSESVFIGEGTVIFANAVINADAKLGVGCIINTAATIDHECKLNKGVHVSPGAHLAGSVTVGKYSWIGIGACVIQNIFLGNGVMVGAGAVVINSFPDNVTIIGTPACIVNAG